MFKFIVKAFLRDKNRSLIPMIVVSAGVFLTISMTGFMRGTMGDMIDLSANFQTGHVKVMTRAYAENADQMPNDLCLLEVAALKGDLQKQYPDYIWGERILFGGLVDHSDAAGNTIAQGAGSVMAIDLSEKSREVQRLNIANCIEKGSLPKPNNGKVAEVLLGYQFAEKLQVEIGDTLNFMGSTMHGSMSFALYVVSGTVRFGSGFMDKSTMIMDLKPAQQVMDMADGASVLLGFHKDNIYLDEATVEMSAAYNAAIVDTTDEFLPKMVSMRHQTGMSATIDQSKAFSSALIFIFMIVMAIVLWNTGLVAALRRYQEFGIRLAVGERKGHIYKSQVIEALVVGVCGSIAGTILGILLVLYLQANPIDISYMMPDDAGMMMPSVMRAKMTADLFFLGFIPGVIATVAGALLAGRGIYKRQTSRLMKEMEI